MSNAEVSAEYCRRAFVARNLAMSASCPDTKAYLLELEQLWLSQARRHEPSNCCNYSRRQLFAKFIVSPLWASSNLVDAPRLGVRPC